MAQSTTGTDLVNNCTAGVMPTPCLVLKLDLADAGFGNEGTWDADGNVSAYVESVSIEAEEHDLQEGGAVSGGVVCAKMTVSLYNDGRRFSEAYAAGPIYDHIGSGWRGIRVYCALGRYDSTNGNETLPQFSGYVVAATEDEGNRCVTLECHDRGWRLQPGVFAGNTAMLVDTTVSAHLAAIVALLPAADQPSISADATLHPIPFAWLDEDNGIREFAELAASQGGSIYFDKEGVLIFKNATAYLRDADSTVSQATFDGDEFVNVTRQSGRADKATRVVTTYTPRYVATSQEVWRASEVYQVRAGETRTETVRLRQPLYALNVPTADTDYAAILAGGVDATDDVAIATANVTSTRLDLQITNSGSFAVYMTYLRLRARPVLTREPLTVEFGDADGEALRVENLYINSEGHAKAIGEMIYDRMSTLRPLVELRGMPALPWLELRDRVTLTYGLGLVTKAYFIVGMRQRWQAGGDYEMDLALLDASLFPAGDWFVVGTSKLGAGSGSGQVWY